MHPNPLFGMGPYLTLDDGGSCRGQFFDTIFERTVSRDRQGRVDFGLVGAIRAPVDEARDDWAASSQGQHGAARGRPCGSAKKGNKDPWNVTNVLINEQCGDPVSGQRTNHLLPRRWPAKNDFGAETAPQSGYQPVEAGIVEPTGGGSQGDVRNRQPGAEKLPGATVACGEDDSTPDLEGFEEILGGNAISRWVRIRFRLRGNRAMAVRPRV